MRVTCLDCGWTGDETECDHEPHAHDVADALVAVIVGRRVQGYVRHCLSCHSTAVVDVQKGRRK